MNRPLFHLDTIENALTQFRESFPSINEQIQIKREHITPVMVGQILEAYDFLNSLLGKNVDLFTPAGLHSLLEMNHIVLCGSNAEKRMEYYQHLQATRAQFLKRIKPIRLWVESHRKTADPRVLATGFYSRNLSQPQLFLEGNHRTGNILFNYLMVSQGAPPFIITPQTAVDYLDISGEMKFTDKEKTFEHGLKMPGHRKRFVTFLSQHASADFLQESGA